MQAGELSIVQRVGQEFFRFRWRRNMQKLLTLAVIVGFLILSSCGKSASNFKPERTQTASAGSDGVPEAKLVSTDEGGTKQLQHPAEGSPNLQKISLTNAENAESAQQAFDRKIIRNAEVLFESKSTPDSQRRIASIVESHSGFVVTSEATQRQGTDTSSSDTTVKLV